MQAIFEIPQRIVPYMYLYNSAINCATSFMVICCQATDFKVLVILIISK